MATARATGTDSRLSARCAATASLGAGVIHAAVTPMHWRDWALSGWFFLALAVFQLAWAVIAWSRPNAWLLAAGIAVNAGAAALWVTACVAGPPVGPSAGQPEAVGAAGISVLLLQCYVVMGSAWAWLSRREPREVSAPARAAVLVGANTVMAGAVLLGLVSSLAGHHHHTHGPAGTAAGQDGHPAGGPAPMNPPATSQDVPARPVTDMAGEASPVPAPLPGDSVPADVASESDGHDHHHD